MNPDVDKYVLRDGTSHTGLIEMVRYLVRREVTLQLHNPKECEIVGCQVCQIKLSKKEKQDEIRLH